jgi:hypothetical protein
MKYISKRLLATGILCLSINAPSFSADFTECQVIEIVLAGEQNAHVLLNCPTQNAPTCASANNYVGFDKSTTAGKQYLALLIYAHANNAKVTGDIDKAICSPWQGNVPLLTHLRMKR